MNTSERKKAYNKVYNKKYREANKEKFREYQHKNRRKYKSRWAKYRATWRAKHQSELKAVYKSYKTLSKYKITYDKYLLMLQACGGYCEICGNELVKPIIDHNHRTGKVRGILCLHCNWLIGHAKENPRTLLSAIGYLHKYNI